MASGHWVVSTDLRMPEPDDLDEPRFLLADLTDDGQAIEVLQDVEAVCTWPISRPLRSGRRR